MKKMTCILLAVVMLFLAAWAAADEIPQPEGGVKFESDWAVENGTAEIYYEEEGYRVFIRIERPGDLTGSEFEYSCYYHEDTDSLVSISALRNDYTVNPDTGEPVYEQDNAYEGIDEEGKETVFTIEEVKTYMGCCRQSAVNLTSVSPNQKREDHGRGAFAK